MVFLAFFARGLGFFWEVLHTLGYAHAARPHLPLLGSPSPLEVSILRCETVDFTDLTGYQYLTLLAPGGVFHLQPSKWLRTPKRNKLSP